MPTFAQRLIDWHAAHGRHDLPWQGTSDPYRIWLSEIMLQQTQVATVIPYYQRFLGRLPTLQDMADAPLTEVMALWSGLGYYARARHLHLCAQMISGEHGGQFPREPEAIARLPGIGRSTANAIAVFCFGARVPILDGNVKRLLCRHLGIEGYPGNRVIETRLWQHGEALLPRHNVAVYVQAQMDLGASVCTRNRPKCSECPLASDCIAWLNDRVADLPTPRPKANLPERQATLLLIRQGNCVLLEQRPPKGIWGGLLSLPELPGDSDVVTYCRNRFGLQVTAVAPAPTVMHSFTHFRLAIQPLICTANGQLQTRQHDSCWLNRKQWTAAGLPAPVRKLLSGIP